MRAFDSNFPDLEIFSFSNLFSGIYNYFAGFRTAISAVSTTALAASGATKKTQRMPLDSYKVEMVKDQNPHINIDTSNDLSPVVMRQKTAKPILLGGSEDEWQKSRGPFFFFQHLIKCQRQDEAINLIKDGQLDVNTFYVHSLIATEGYSTLLSLASYNGASKVVEYIMNCEELSPKVVNGTLKMLIDDKVEWLPKFWNYTDFTPLMFAAIGSANPKVAEALLKSEHVKREINKKNSVGDAQYTALQIAISNRAGGDPAEFVEALIDAGAEVDSSMVALCKNGKKARTLICLVKKGLAQFGSKIFQNVHTANEFNSFGYIRYAPQNDPAIIYGASIISYLMSSMVNDAKVDGNNLVISSKFSFIDSGDLFKVHTILTRFWNEHTQPIFAKDLPDMSPELFLKIKNAVAGMIDEKSNECRIELTHTERVECERMLNTQTQAIAM